MGEQNNGLRSTATILLRSLFAELAFLRGFPQEVGAPRKGNQLASIYLLGEKISEHSGCVDPPHLERVGKSGLLPGYGQDPSLVRARPSAV